MLKVTNVKGGHVTKSKEGCMGGFEGKRGEGKIMQLYYILKNPASLPLLSCVVTMMENGVTHGITSLSD